MCTFVKLKKTDMKISIPFYFLSFVFSFFVLESCSLNTKETTADVSFYKVVEYQTFLDSIKQKNGGMNWANIDYSPESLIGKLQRKGHFTVEDTTKANEFLTKDMMPKNMSYAWIAHEDNAKTCVLVIYYSTPIYNKQLKIGEVNKREDIGEMNVPVIFENKKDLYDLTNNNINQELAYSINGKIITKAKITAPIEGGVISGTTTETTLKQIFQL